MGQDMFKICDPVEVQGISLALENIPPSFAPSTKCPMSFIHSGNPKPRDIAEDEKEFEAQSYQESMDNGNTKMNSKNETGLISIFK